MSLPVQHLHLTTTPQHPSPPRANPRANHAARLSVRIRPVPAAPASARRLVRDACADWNLPEALADEAATVAGLLVLTSVHQVRSVLRLTVMAGGVDRFGRCAVLVEVEDHGREDPSAHPTTPPWTEDNLSRVASASGSARMPGGRQLWARVGATGPILAAVPDPPGGR